ncbi:hypothetical protein L1887_45279 [Cichorium endivia]|nr:hypothetical protein L1887_45279 [Cichorium endivia]
MVDPQSAQSGALSRHLGRTFAQFDLFNNAHIHLLVEVIEAAHRHDGYNRQQAWIYKYQLPQPFNRSGGLHHVGHIADLGEHDPREEARQRLGYLPEEGKAGINRPLGAHAGAPLAVFHGIGYQRPVQAVHKRGAKERQAGERHKAHRSAAEEIVEQVARHPDRQPADVDLFLAEAPHRAGHHKDADKNTAHAEEAHVRQQNRVVQHVLRVVDLDGKLDVKGTQRAQVGDAQDKQRTVPGDGAKRLQQPRLLRRICRLRLDVTFGHALIAPPHKEQAEQREEGRGKDIAKLVVALDQVHHRHKAHGTEQQAQRSAALAPGGQRGALVRIFGNSRYHRAVGAVHHAEEQAVQHKQHRRHHRFTGHLKRRADEVGNRQEGHRKRGIQHERAEFSFRADLAPGVEHDPGAHIGEGGKKLRNQEDDPAVGARQPQHVGVKLQQIKRADIQQDV